MLFLDNEIEICYVTKEYRHNTLVFLKMSSLEIDVVEDKFRKQNRKNIVDFSSFKWYPVHPLKIQTILEIILIFLDERKDVDGD